MGAACYVWIGLKDDTAKAHNTDMGQEKRMTRQRHIIRIWDKRNEYKVLAGKSSRITQPLKLKTSWPFETLPFVRTRATLHKIPDDKNHYHNHHHQGCGNVKSRYVHWPRGSGVRITKPAVRGPLCPARFILTFRRRIKSRLLFAGIIRRLPYSTRFQDKG